MPENCLIVIDMQNDFLDRLERARRADLIAETNRLIDSFRAARCPVIWIRQSFRPDLSDAFLEMKDRRIPVVIDGSKGAEIDPGLARDDGDAVIVKKRCSPFFGTKLDQVLREPAPDKITLAGVSTRMRAAHTRRHDATIAFCPRCYIRIEFVRAHDHP